MEDKRKFEDEKRVVVEDKRNLEEVNNSLIEKNRKLEEETVCLDEKIENLNTENLELVEKNLKLGEENCKLGEENLQSMEEIGKLQGANNLSEEENRKLSEAKKHMMEEKSSLTKSTKALQKKMTDQVKVLEEQQSMVECPVCLMLPRAGPAVPCCPQDHFICPQCLQQRKTQDKQDCPTCRGPMGQGRSLLAFTVVKQAKHECTLKGCSAVVPFDEIKQHEERCSWRLVICPGSNRTCKVMVPFQKVEEHAKDCPDFLAPPVEDEGTGVLCKRVMLKRLEKEESLKWRTQLVKYEDQIFFARLKREANAFTLDVVMKASEGECENYLVEASMMDVRTGKLIYKAIFPPRPIVKENKPGYCLVVQQKAMDKVWKFFENEGKYSFGHHIKINRNIRV